jgi:transposase
VLAARLQISESCLRSWLDQADIDENGSEFRLTSVEKQELAQLRREKRRLQTENEILKRAVADLVAAGECAPAVQAGRTTRRVPS